MIKWLLSIFKWILVLITGGPSQEAQEASKAAQATQALDTEGKALSELQNAVTARANADAKLVRDDPNGDHVTLDPNAPINTDPNAYFRD